MAWTSCTKYGSENATSEHRAVNQTIKTRSGWVLFRSKSFDSYMVIYKAQIRCAPLGRFDAHVQGLHCSSLYLFLGYLTPVWRPSSRPISVWMQLVVASH